MVTPSRLAVVICTYNRSGLLTRTLASLYDDGYLGEESVDIMVVANNCSDDTLSRLGSFKMAHSNTRLRLDWLQEPRAGKSFALNAAIERTHNEVLCFVDDDQTVEPGFLQHLLEGLDRYREESIFCGRLWPAWDGSEPSWVHATDSYAIPIRPFPEFDLGDSSALIGPEGRFPGGGNITVRRGVFERVGRFSVELGPVGHNLGGGEDHEFLHRATQGGFSIRYLPGVRQLHAIDSERMSSGYVIRKSYVRSRAAFLVRAGNAGPRLYMLRKILSHLANAVCTLDADRRFFYFVRLAASVAELTAAVELIWRSSSSRRRARLPTDRHDVVLALLGLATVSLGLGAWLASGDAARLGALPAAAVAAIGTAVLLAKTLSDFTQTGPQIKAEVTVHYRSHVVWSLFRLCFWAFAILLFTGGGGVLVYYAINVLVDGTWSAWLAALAAAAGILLASGLQFMRKLRRNPGLIVGSMHYRVSRLFRLWNWAAPGRLRVTQTALAAIGGLILAGASWRLEQQHRTSELIALWSAVMAYAGVITWAGWSPEPRAPRHHAARKNEGQPNILLIGSDTLRADRLGAFGYHRALTPNIDALASQGVVFTNCYVPCARTAPSLVSLLTGTWPQTHGIRDNFVASSEAGLRVQALPGLLKAQGYRTAAVSDWCGSDMGKFSFGFEHLDLPEDQWNLKYLIRQGPKDLRLFISLFAQNRLGRLALPELFYLGGVPLTTQIGRRGRRMLSKLAMAPEPFFLNVFYSTTHPPFASEWPWYVRFANHAYMGESKFAMAKLVDPFEIIRRQSAPKEEFDLDQIIDLYDGCVAQFDSEVGQVLGHLQACGLLDNTIVLVYSDHGMEFFEHDTWGQGNSVVGDFSARIPLVVHDPRYGARGTVDSVVRSVDVAPTLLELVGLKPPAKMDGVSLAACISAGEPCPELDAYNETGIWISEMPGQPEHHLHYPDLLELLEVPDYGTGTLALKPEYREIVLKAKDRMIRRGPWKLTYQPLTSGRRLQLFNVDEDPTCKVNVLDRFPEIAACLEEVLLARVAQDAGVAPVVS